MRDDGELRLDLEVREAGERHRLAVRVVNVERANLFRLVPLLDPQPDDDRDDVIALPHLADPHPAEGGLRDLSDLLIGNA